MKKIFAAIFVMAAVGIGCDRKAAPEATEGAPEGAAEHEQQKTAQPGEPEDPAETREDELEVSGERWSVVAADELEGEVAGRLERAKTAQKALGKTLMGALSESVSEKGFAKSVTFCHDEAPEIAAQVADKHDVAIGRTSFKLRNPDNAPPAWARPLVEDRVAEARVLRGPDGKVGWFKPIRLGELCVNCHGSKGQLAEGVPEMLSKHYPQDQATGFESGDLRGWFWVEAPPEG